MTADPTQYAPYTAVQAEGARIALFVCLVCGATVMNDPREDWSALDLHAAWHKENDGGQ